MVGEQFETLLQGRYKKLEGYFCVACKLIWRWRNGVVHHGSCSSVDYGMVEAIGIVRCMVRANKFLGGHGRFLRYG